MKTLITAVIISFALASDSVAAQTYACGDLKTTLEKCSERLLAMPQPPSAQVVSDLQKLLNAADRARSAEQVLASRLEGLKTELKDVAGYEFYRKVQLKKLKEETRKQQKAAKRKMIISYRIAVDKTIKAYKLEPAFRAVPAAIRPAKSIKPWNPTYSGCEKIDAFGKCQVKQGWEREMENQEIYGTVNYARGSDISLYPMAFKSPDLLATVILHEGMHWIQSIRFWGFPPSPSEYLRNEADAYRLQSLAATRLGMKVRAQRWSDRAKKELADSKAVANKGMGWIKGHRPDIYRRLRSVGYSKGPVGDAVANLGTMKKRSEGDLLSSLNRQTQDLSHAREQGLAEEEAQLTAYRLEREKAERRKALLELVINACLYIESEDSLASSFRDYVANNRVVLPEEELRELIDDPAFKYRECNARMLRLFLDAPGVIDADWLLAELDREHEQYLKNHDTLVKKLDRVGKSIDARLAKIVRGIAKPFVATADALKKLGEGSPDRGGEKKDHSSPKSKPRYERESEPETEFDHPPEEPETEFDHPPDGWDDRVPNQLNNPVFRGLSSGSFSFD